MLGRILICFALVACSDNGTTGSSSSDLIDEGSTVNGVACDASMDGEAQCGDDTTMVYCSNGEWWGQDCTAQGADVCIDDGTLVDCVIESS
ncbi:MAG TPA: hypothetical protein VFQ65_25240 [Kofleriaceae bacterium]|nr:hypothetical protein [Kofleriaceae bacterium]